MTDYKFNIREMKEEESEEIADILLYYASRAVLLWRTADDIRLHKDNFFVAESQGKIIGCVAIEDYSNGLYELRSLAVQHDNNGKGIGSALINRIIEECKQRQGKSLFALTKQKNFFIRLDFKLTEREFFPQKVWNDCILCHKKHACDEEAVVFKL